MKPPAVHKYLGDDPTATRTAKAGLLTPVGGVEWCVTHHGIVDECNDHDRVCDMAALGDCDVRPLFFGVRS